MSYPHSPFHLVGFEELVVVLVVVLRAGGGWGGGRSASLHPGEPDNANDEIMVILSFLSRG